ncbi:uncharacterized protein PSFLO_01791 [Pseudozyma flocculosa]|uniref:Uncharacterized protein n=1 Tax=Pseudozyma flocculosa TaxID=84751 RepID=A0A5C3EWS9_9BASI|nr:uncharacterized protein PSFLO_01791 [Pseudozyma flocculosa]
MPKHALPCPALPSPAAAGPAGPRKKKLNSASIIRVGRPAAAASVPGNQGRQGRAGGPTHRSSTTRSRRETTTRGGGRSVAMLQHGCGSRAGRQVEGRQAGLTLLAPRLQRYVGRPAARPRWAPAAYVGPFPSIRSSFWRRAPGKFAERGNPAGLSTLLRPASQAWPLEISSTSTLLASFFSSRSGGGDGTRHDDGDLGRSAGRLCTALVARERSQEAGRPEERAGRPVRTPPKQAACLANRARPPFRLPSAEATSYRTHQAALAQPGSASKKQRSARQAGTRGWTACSPRSHACVLQMTVRSTTASPASAEAVRRDTSARARPALTWPASPGAAGAHRFSPARCQHLEPGPVPPGRPRIRFEVAERRWTSGDGVSEARARCGWCQEVAHRRGAFWRMHARAGLANQPARVVREAG